MSFRVIRAGSESYYWIRNKRELVGLDVRDAYWYGMAVRKRTALVLHELGHRFGQRGLKKKHLALRDRVFGKYLSFYRRDWKRVAEKASPSNYVSKYAAAHPAEDFAETFAFVLWFGDRFREAARERGLGAACQAKIRTMNRLILENRARLRSRLLRPL